MNKPDCYKCVHRGTRIGDAHSCCGHPEIAKNPADAVYALVQMGRYAQGQIDSVSVLRIQAEPHGIMNGWFSWPINFDPVWLRNCEGFEEKENNG